MPLCRLVVRPVGVVLRAGEPRSHAHDTLWSTRCPTNISIQRFSLGLGELGHTPGLGSVAKVDAFRRVAWRWRSGGRCGRHGVVRRPKRIFFGPLRVIRVLIHLFHVLTHRRGNRGLERSQRGWSRCKRMRCCGMSKVEGIFGGDRAGGWRLGNGAPDIESSEGLSECKSQRCGCTWLCDHAVESHGTVETDLKDGVSRVLIGYGTRLTRSETHLVFAHVGRNGNHVGHRVARKSI
jgi:hypothetical protein